MSVFTKIGSSIWMWPPFRRLERSPDDAIGRGAKLLYLHLYTAPEAKASVPGLYAGSVTTISESMGTPPDEIRRYLDRLIEDDLVEFDVEKRVLRLVVLPDSGESPTNGNTIRGWWRKFQNVPACPVRDAHVPVLYWIMQEWSRVNDKAISADHMKAWNETFGRISVPSPRPRPRKHVQTSLFAPSESLPETLPTDQLSTDRGETPQSVVPDLRPNDFNSPERNAEPFPKERDQDRRSGSGSGSLYSADGSGSSLPQTASRPRLTLVPAPPATEVSEMLAALCSGVGLDDRHAAVRDGSLDGLCRTMSDLRAHGATRDEVLAIGRWARSRCALGNVPGDPHSKLSAWAAIPGMVIAGLKAVREQARRTAEVQDQLDAIRRGGAVPT